MCGIVGAAGSLAVADENCFKQLLVVDSLRGNDSTGVASIFRNGNSKVVKQLGEPFTLMEYPAFRQAFAGQVQCLIGHNRFATTGKINKKNAHPFEFDTLIGVHNGTLTSKWELKNHTQYDTDSEALYDHIELEGLKDAIEKVQGAYSLVWYDKVGNTINFLRNKERPMFLAVSKDKKKIFWASEAWMLEGIMERNHIPYLDIIETTVDHHYSYAIPKVNEEFTKAKVIQVKQKEKVLQNNFTKGRVGFVNQESSSPANKNVVVPYSLGQVGSIKNLLAVWAGRSPQGADFIQMKCADFPNHNFRVFFKTEEEKNNILKVKEWQGKIKEICDLKTAFPYYKVALDSLKPLVSASSLSPPGKKVDHTGTYITKKDFEMNYANCIWCSSPVTYEEKFHIINHKEILCESCKEDPEINQYIPNLV